MDTVSTFISAAGLTPPMTAHAAVNRLWATVGTWHCRCMSCSCQVILHGWIRLWLPDNDSAPKLFESVWLTEQRSHRNDEAEQVSLNGDTDA